MKLKSNEMKSKTRFVIALCTVLALSAGSLIAQDYDKDKSQSGTGSPSKLETGASIPSGQLSRSDEKFVRDAAKGGMMEVYMGKMGTQQAQSSEVKQFAQKLIDDHSKANSELQEFAARKGITLPQEREGITSTDTDRDYSAGAGAPGKATGTTTSDSDRSRVRDKNEAHPSAPDQAHSEMKKLHGLTGSDFDREYIRQSVKHHEKNVREFEQASKKVEDQELKGWVSKTLPTLREHLQAAQSLQGRVGNTGAPGTDAGNSSGNASSGTTSSSGSPGQGEKAVPTKQ